MTDLIAAVRASGVRRAAHTGDVLMREGAAGDRVIVLERGRVKVSVRSETPVPAVLAVRGAGELLGELAALTRRPRTATVTCLEPCVFHAEDADRFRRRVVADAQHGVALLGLVAARLGAADARLTEHLVDDTRTRIARRLLELFGSAGPGAALPLTQAEVAALAGASLEATGKALRGLRREGVVDGGRGRIVLADGAALAAVAGRR